MDRKFKWDMFITSFIPLWLSIIVADIWNIVDIVSNKWSYSKPLKYNLVDLYKKCQVSIWVVIIIFVLMLVSIISINKFLKDIRNCSTPPKIKIKKAVRANKLSSEFLLAYILPMIAFDFSELKSVSIFIIYFSVLAFLCIRNSNVYTNILFEFKGYKMYLCDLEADRMGRPYMYVDCLIISKNNLTAEIDNDMQYWDFDNYIYIDLG